jgi:hypothetical protein
MNACKKNSFRPTLEALEDRYMPSASPWGMLAQPMMNASATESALGGTVAHRHNQIDVLRTESRDLVLASQQNQASTLTHTTSNQTVSRPKVDVSLFQNLHIHGKGFENLGALWIDNRYTGDPNFKLQIKFKMWQPGQKEPEYQVIDLKKIELREVKSDDPTHHKYSILVDKSFFQGQHAVILDLRFEVVPKAGGKAVDAGSNRAQYKIDHVSSEQNQTSTPNVGNHLASAAEMSARDQFFVAQGGRTMFDGHETVDGFLMQAREHGWTHMSETGSPNSSPFYHETNGMNQNLAV